VFDDEVHIGSSNFDFRSLYLNMEMMLRVDDAEFTSLMRLYFEGELDDSLAITRDAWRKRSTIFNRIKWGLSFFLVTAVDYTVTAGSTSARVDYSPLRRLAPAQNRSRRAR
jgi:cardiolipin synthase